MPPPSPLAIATGAVNRLLKEELSYHTELAEQEAQVKVLEERIKNGQDDEEGNGVYLLRQQKMVVQQTQAVFKPLRIRIADAVAKLEDLVASEKQNGGRPAVELENAEAAIAKEKATQRSEL